MAKDLATHLLVHVVLGQLELLAQRRIEVASVVLELQEPAHMVDSGAQEVDFVLGHVDIARDEAHRRLHAVAQTDILHIRRAQRPADHRHRVHVLKDVGIRAKLLHVGRHVQDDGDRSKSSEHTPGSERVPNTLVHTIVERDTVVMLKSREPPHLERRDDVVGTLQSLAPVRRRPYGGWQTVGLNDAPGERLHVGRAPSAGRHQRELRILQTICRENVEQKRLAEHDTACADDRNLRHSIPPLYEFSFPNPGTPAAWHCSPVGNRPLVGSYDPRFSKK